ncbi:PstA family ABC transporter permease [Verrucomicrobium spinosum]|uniref:PstA family ABC transporter permease n=1 Tax=Verrucomicrobium spinosum TaxID=2736 RepID=UPI000174539C|nr:ABC transporter permease subunit [Verrucomicrobium spinosum]
MRKLLDAATALVAFACALLALALLGGLVYLIVQKGGPAISWGFFTEQIRLVGAAGGIFWNLIGTLILLLTAFLASAPIAIALALMERVWLNGDTSRRILTTGLYAINGVPSIVFGIFGFIVLVQWCGWGKSWLAGGLILAMVILPTVTVALVERLKAIPMKYVEAAAGLGLSRAQIVWAVLLPQSWGGLITGSLLGLARAAGEVAPIMFTATIFAGATMPQAIKESPVLSLPYHIFILAQDSFDPGVGSKLWGSALVLLGLVFSLSLAALPTRLRIHEEAHHG